MPLCENLKQYYFTAKELAENSHVQDAFVIAVEQQAKERLERLSALRKIKPVDMTKLSQQVGGNLSEGGRQYSCPPDTADPSLAFLTSFVWFLVSGNVSRLPWSRLNS